MTVAPARGEVWWCELPVAGRRPAIVLSRDSAIPRLRRAMIAPCTTTVRGLPSEVVLEPGEDAVPMRCAVSIDTVETVPLGTLTARIGRLADAKMMAVCDALAVAVDCVPR